MLHGNFANLYKENFHFLSKKEENYTLNRSQSAAVNDSDGSDA
jgi:hypothetical protein